ncbi:hypothetical protein GCM10008934_08380 [Virgibacillus salarius]
MQGEKSIMKRKTFIIISALLIISLVITACTNDDKEKSNEEDTATQAKEQPKKSDSGTLQVPKTEMQKKDSGESVKALQKVLSAIGYDIKNTGKFDESTIWAITDIQLQHESLPITGIYSEDTAEVVHSLLQDSKEYVPGEGLPFKAEPAATKHGSEILANPYEQLALVNKEHALPEDYIPEDLVIPDVRFPFTEDLPKKQMREIAASSLEKLFHAADKAGLDLFAQSGYRSYDRQVSIFTANVNEHGEEAANNFSARPGESEHQTGLTMDVTSPDVNYQLIIEFGETDEGKWLKEHAAHFGFIIRYPEGKEAITHYQYEPWHIRYVGKKAAEDIMNNDLTLEEYLSN